MQIEEDSNDHN